MRKKRMSCAKRFVRRRHGKSWKRRKRLFYCVRMRWKRGRNARIP